MIERFTNKELDQFYFNALHTAVQNKGQTPEQFADRLRKLANRTIILSQDPAVQNVLNSEAKRLKGAFSSGIESVVGDQVRFRCPGKIEDDLKIAILFRYFRVAGGMMQALLAGKYQEHPR